MTVAEIGRLSAGLETSLSQREEGAGEALPEADAGRRAA
jgi:hypothetical protein